jgi:hypothetical protein
LAEFSGIFWSLPAAKQNRLLAHWVTEAEWRENSIRARIKRLLQNRRRIMLPRKAIKPLSKNVASANSSIYAALPQTREIRGNFRGDWRSPGRGSPLPFLPIGLQKSDFLCFGRGFQPMLPFLPKPGSTLTFDRFSRAEWKVIFLSPYLCCNSLY